MNPETLTCTVCGREVRIVRLGRATLALDHTTNPRNDRHPVQLSRSAAGASIRGREDNQRQSEAARHGASSQRTNGTRPASEGRSRTALPPGSHRAFRGARVDGGPPTASSRSAKGSTP